MRNMASKLHELEKQILQLSAHERAFLAKKLIRSLDEGEEEEVDPDLEQLWAEEAHRRYEAYKEGKTTARNADQVMKEARSKFS